MKKAITAAIATSVFLLSLVNCDDTPQAPIVTNAGSNALLSTLSVEGETLGPSFNSLVFSYFVFLSNETTNVNITASPVDTNASVKINSSTYIPSTTWSYPSNIPVGTNVVTISVLAENLITSASYKVSLVRSDVPKSSDAAVTNVVLSDGSLDPDFPSSVLEYKASVSSNVSNIRLTAYLRDTNATLKLNALPILNGIPSYQVSLKPGTNGLVLHSLAENGITERFYYFYVYRTPPSKTWQTYFHDDFNRDDTNSSLGSTNWGINISKGGSVCLTNEEVLIKGGTLGEAFIDLFRVPTNTVKRVRFRFRWTNEIASLWCYLTDGMFSHYDWSEHNTLFGYLSHATSSEYYVAAGGVVYGQEYSEFTRSSSISLNTEYEAKLTQSNGAVSFVISDTNGTEIHSENNSITQTNGYDIYYKVLLGGGTEKNTSAGLYIDDFYLEEFR